MTSRVVSTLKKQQMNKIKGGGGSYSCIIPIYCLPEASIFTKKQKKNYFSSFKGLEIISHGPSLIIMIHCKMMFMHHIHDILAVSGLCRRINSKTPSLKCPSAMRHHCKWTSALPTNILFHPVAAFTTTLDQIRLIRCSLCS